jgi:hypothetical protein
MSLGIKRYAKVNFPFSTSVQVHIPFNAKEVVLRKIFHFVS